MRIVTKTAFGQTPICKNAHCVVKGILCDVENCTENESPAVPAVTDFIGLITREFLIKLILIPLIRLRAAFVLLAGYVVHLASFGIVSASLVNLAAAQLSVWDSACP